MASTPQSTAAFEAIATEYFPQLNGPGMAVAVVKGDQVLWAQGYGWAETEANLEVTTDTAFLLASGSKMFTATALMQLYDRGLFALDDDVNSYLPFKVRHPAYPDIPITFRMLLSHGASLGDN